MTATAKRRKSPAKKTVKGKARRPAYSPWVQRLNDLAEPLTGKLTKAINSK